MGEEPSGKRKLAEDQGGRRETYDPSDLWRNIFEAVRTKEDVAWLLSEPWQLLLRAPLREDTGDDVCDRDLVFNWRPLHWPSCKYLFGPRTPMLCMPSPESIYPARIFT